MARENQLEDARSTDHDSSETTDSNSIGAKLRGGDRPSEEALPIDINCPSCERGFTFGEWTNPAHDERTEPSCPTCDESFSVRLYGAFALVERGGWAVSVSFEREERRP